MPDDLTTTPAAMFARLDAVAERQLLLLEATISDLRPRMSAEGLDLEDAMTLASQIGALAHVMLQWAGILLGVPVNEEEGEE